jgi:hypothetical protein
MDGGDDGGDLRGVLLAVTEHQDTVPEGLQALDDDPGDVRIRLGGLAHPGQGSSHPPRAFPERYADPQPPGDIADVLLKRGPGSAEFDQHPLGVLEEPVPDRCQRDVLAGPDQQR